MRPKKNGRKKPTGNRYFKQFTVVSLIVIAVILMFLVYQAKNKVSEETSINYGPSTTEEKNQSEARKDSIISKQETNSRPKAEDGRMVVNPLFVIVNQDEIRAYVPGTIEDGGECRLELTMGDKKITKVVSATTDGRVTNCYPFMLGNGDFTQSGMWSATVTYYSETATGTTDSTMLEVKI